MVGVSAPFSIFWGTLLIPDMSRIGFGDSCSPSVLTLTEEPDPEFHPGAFFLILMRSVTHSSFDSATGGGSLSISGWGDSYVNLNI